MRSAPDTLLPLDEAVRRLHPFARFHLGVRPIPIRQIVGSAGRVGDFDRRFVPRRRGSLGRLEELSRAFPGGDFPAISVQQLGDAYFVIDGHHRVALARRRGMEMLDADVTVMRARWHLLEDAGQEDLVHAEQEWLFMRESGLAETHPEVQIRFSKAIGYSQLLADVEAHGYRMMRGAGAVVAPEEAAGDWYERVYIPATTAIERDGIEGVCANASIADRFLWVGEVERELRVDCRCATFDDVLRRAMQKSSARRRRLRLRG